jgi:hypothetical protein
VYVEDFMGAAQHIWLVLLQPEDFIQRGRHRHRLAGNLVNARIAETRVHRSHLRQRALVEPQDCVANRPALFIHKHERLTLVRDADRANTLHIDLAGGGTQRLSGRIPPGISALLVPAGLRVQQRKAGAALGDRLAVAIPDHRFAGGGAAIDRDHQIGRCIYDSLRGHPSLGFGLHADPIVNRQLSPQHAARHRRSRRLAQRPRWFVQAESDV